jgi:hypothetical protein
MAISKARLASMHSVQANSLYYIYIPLSGFGTNKIYQLWQGSKYVLSEKPFRGFPENLYF